jgi:hypothetical protein
MPASRRAVTDQIAVTAQRTFPAERTRPKAERCVECADPGMLRLGSARIGSDPRIDRVAAQVRLESAHRPCAPRCTRIPSCTSKQPSQPFLRVQEVQAA